MPSRANNKRLFPGKPVRNRSVPVFLCGESRAGYFACSHLWAYDISPDSIEKLDKAEKDVQTIHCGVILDSRRAVAPWNRENAGRRRDYEEKHQA